MKKFFLALAALLILPMAAHAVPVQYEITFSANGGDADGGSGSFYWDDITHQLSSLTWDFGAGQSGGVNDALANWGFNAFGGSLAEFAFEVITLQDVHPTPCTDFNVGCGVQFSSSNGVYGYPGSHIHFFKRYWETLQYYELHLGSERVLSGTFETRLAVNVPEPSSLALFAVGLFAIGAITASRRRRQGN